MTLASEEVATRREKAREEAFKVEEIERVKRMETCDLGEQVEARMETEVVRQGGAGAVLELESTVHIKERDNKFTVFQHMYLQKEYLHFFINGRFHITNFSSHP